MREVSVVSESCGTVHVAGTRAAAQPGAQLCGDVYGVVDSPFGVRAIIADVCGHGDDAGPLAEDVLSTFRTLAGHEPGIAGLAVRLDMFVTSQISERAEKFVTAALVEVRDVTVEVVSCGHPPPLLVRRGLARELPGLDPSPPLGLAGAGGQWCTSVSMPFEDGDTLLLYTDGATEARSPAGDTYPFAERAAQLITDDPATYIGLLKADLLGFAGGRPHDDVALLYLRKEPDWARAPAP